MIQPKRTIKIMTAYDTVTRYDGPLFGVSILSHGPEQPVNVLVIRTNGETIYHAGDNVPLEVVPGLVNWVTACLVDDDCLLRNECEEMLQTFINPDWQDEQCRH